jgi:hypothetical protein
MVVKALFGGDFRRAGYLLAGGQDKEGSLLVEGRHLLALLIWGWSLSA